MQRRRKLDEQGRARGGLGEHERVAQRGGCQHRHAGVDEEGIAVGRRQQRLPKRQEVRQREEAREE